MIVQPRSPPRDVQVLREVRKRDVHRRDVEDDHQLGESKEEEQDHAGALAARTGTVAVDLLRV